MTRARIGRRLADVVFAKAGNNKIIKGTQSDRPGGGLVQGFSASGPDVWVGAADYTQPGVVLSAVGARCGKTFLAEGAWTAIANTHVLIPSAELDPRWLWYLTNDESFWIRGGSAQPFVKVKDTLQKEVDIPSLPEQRRIVAILDEAFEAIATAKANTEKNLQNARELPAVVLRNLLAKGADSWAESTIGEQVTLQRGFDITKDLQRDGSVPVVSSGGVRSYHDTHMVRAPGVVMGRKGTLGKVFFLEEDFWPHDTTLWVKDFKGNDPRFVYRFFEVLEVKGLDSGAANPALNRNQVHALRVLWPPVDEQVDLAERIEGISIGADQLASTYSAKLAALDELKKSLLHQAFTGQLTAKTTDKQLAEVE